jgi:hypothetical protein
MRDRTIVARIFAPLALLCLLLFGAPAAQARVDVHFHSFNGSLFFGRYPHTFVVFEGQLDDTGERIFENYGFSARRASPAVLRGPVEHMVLSEEEKYITSTNRHFTLSVSDDTYRRMKAEVIAWRDAPGKYYELATRNCIHFVGRIAELGGMQVTYPPELVRKPRAWLNHVSELNPQVPSQIF